MGLAEVLKIKPVYYEYNGKAGIKDTETRHVGLIAQDFNKIAPYAVRTLKYQEIINEGDDQVYKTGETMDYLAMDGSSIKYMLVNAVKEQQQTIESQNSEIADLKTALQNLTETVKGLQAEPSGITSTIEGSGKAYLEQNKPNPLEDYTRIEYFIPQESGKAFLTVQNLAGQLIQRIDITEKGKGFIELKLKNMPAGVYSYRLKVDGNTIDTKKMIVE